MEFAKMAPVMKRCTVSLWNSDSCFTEHSHITILNHRNQHHSIFYMLNTFHFVYTQRAIYPFQNLKRKYYILLPLSPIFLHCF